MLILNFITELKNFESKNGGLCGLIEISPKSSADTAYDESII
jgi:hypothetical protein